jgi:dihydrofolate reductase
MTRAAGLAMIAAVAKDGAIGQGGKLPWHLPEDMKHFRALTTGHAVIMGRKTFESIGRPLPKRRNIVITRQSDRHIPGCDVANDLPAAVALAQSDDACPFIIGGAAIYREAMHLATHLFITEVDSDVDGDVFFPEVPAYFEVTERRKGETPGVTFVTYERRADQSRGR